MNILENYKTGVVIVYSIGRSGSTLLCNYISNMLNIPNAGEIFHRTNPDAWRDRDNALALAEKNKTDFVCKVFADDSINREFFGNRTKFYTVNLIREDIAKQFVSMYVANQTGRWQTWGTGEFKTDSNLEVLSIDESIFKQQFINFKDYLMLKENLDREILHYDETVVYEQVVDFLNQSKFKGDTVESLKPVNYQIILEKSKTLIKEFVENNESKHVPVIMNNYYNKNIIGD
jgi:LPS sulfotransferase NodH